MVIFHKVSTKKLLINFSAPILLSSSNFFFTLSFVTIVLGWETPGAADKPKPGSIVEGACESNRWTANFFKADRLW